MSTTSSSAPEFSAARRAAAACRSTAYISNRLLTAWQNLFLGAKLSEYHTGYRAFSRKVLETLPLLENSDDFVFDNEMLTQCVFFGFRIGEVSCPTSLLRRGVVDQLSPQRPLRTLASWAPPPSSSCSARGSVDSGSSIRKEAPGPRRAARRTGEEPTFALGMAGAAWLTGVAIHWNNGYYNPSALLLITAAIAVGMACLWRPSRAIESAVAGSCRPGPGGRNPDRAPC